MDGFNAQTHPRCVEKTVHDDAGLDGQTVERTHRDVGFEMVLVGVAHDFCDFPLVHFSVIRAESIHLVADVNRRFLFLGLDNKPFLQKSSPLFFYKKPFYELERFVAAQRMSAVVLAELASVVILGAEAGAVFQLTEQSRFTAVVLQPLDDGHHHILENLLVHAVLAVKRLHIRVVAL